MPGSASGRWQRKPKSGLALDTRPFQIVSGEGPIPAKIMLIGERPGEQEARAGRPFVGLSGRYLNTFLEVASLDRDEMYVTNLVKEYHDYVKPSQLDIQLWWPVLVDEIALVRPDYIGLLGTYAVEAVLGTERAHMERVHGVPVRATIGGFHECICVPMFHPAAGFYSTEIMGKICGDVQALALTIQGILTPREDIFDGQENYTEIDGGNCTVRADVAIDTEGDVQRPWCLTYSVYPGQSYLQRPGNVSQFASDIIYLHNSMHDLGVLRRLGTPIPEGNFRDTMVWAYLLQLEPQGLKDLAFRHAGMAMQSYDDIIGDANRDRAIEYLLGADACEWNEASPYVIIEGGKARVRKPHSINRRIRGILDDIDNDKRNKEGEPTDPRERWGKVEDYLKQEVIDELGEMPEATLDDVSSHRAREYACRDSDATIRVAPVLQAKISAMGLDRTSEIDHDVLPIFDRMQHVGIQLAGREFWDSLEAKCQGVMDKAQYLIYQLTGAEINPDSHKQTKELLFDQLGLPVTKMTKGSKLHEPEASTIDKALEAIYRLHPVVDPVLDYREASKIKNSYCRPLRRAATTGDGRVHCTFRLTRVVTGRPSATNPNLLAIPVRSKLGKEIRGGFTANDGRVIGDWDEDQVEMRWMADESGDETLIKLFVDGDKDVHTQTASDMFGVAYGNVAVEQRYAAKRVGFGVITGITEYGLVDQMALARAKRTDGKDWTKDDCKSMIDAWFKIYGGVKRFMVAAGDEVYATGMARDRWGRIRYLPGVWSPIPEIAAEARRQASSFKIQAGAQGYMKQSMKSVWDYVIKPHMYNYDYDDRWPIEPLLQIYDSMVFEMDEKLAEGGIGADIVMCLTKTVESKRGVPFTAKGGYGKTWLTVK